MEQISSNCKTFIQDAINRTQYLDIKISANGDISILIDGQNLVIEYNTIQKYYEGYLMSNQPREDAILRMARYITELIEIWKSKVK